MESKDQYDESELKVDESLDGREETDEQLEPSHAQYELLTYPADFTLEVLHQKFFKNRDIEIPTFQRKFVWTATQASRLIESFLLGLPVPPIFLYSPRGSEKLLVVDGQQRLRAIAQFFEGHFGEETEAGKVQVFRLRLDEHSRWNGKTLEDLDEEEKARLKNGVLRAYIMKQINPRDDKSIFYVFERLNTGGTLLRAQEVRNCVYDGPFNQLLHELNRRGSWREILGKPRLDPRLKDVELILRFLALLSKRDSYEKPMNEFLTEFMRQNRGGQENETWRKAFEQASDAVLKSLGQKPFHVKAGLNAAVFDAVFVAFGTKSTAAAPSDIGMRFEKLKEDSRFKEYTERATSDDESVKRRIALAIEQLFE